MNPLPHLTTDTPFCIGLTGGIGCGKSTVANLFKAHGAGIIDTDEIAHQLTRADGEAIQAIIAAFGPKYITTSGALDRHAMRALIFTDKNSKITLEQILHPLILAHSKELIHRACDKPYLILMVPLLFETPGFLQLVQRTLLVDCSEENQISRVIKRNGMNEEQIRTIIQHQMTRQARRRLNDDIVQNDGSLDTLTALVLTLHKRYLHTGQ